MGMITELAAIGAWLALVPSLQTPTDASAERLHGVVITATGERLEGYLRWDRNETHWADVLDGRTTIPREHTLDAERLDDELRARRELERSVSLPGLRITWDEDDDAPPELSASGVRFGHVRTVETRDRRALLTLVSGEQVELAASSSDLGRGFRGLVVERPGREDVEIEWEDLVRVELAEAPPGSSEQGARRLHGTLLTRGGGTWTGFVAWDLDETLTSDVLDGDRTDGERMRIPLRDVASIARESRSSVRVTLTTGEELVLDGTNDVDDDNRGIEISDPSFGRATVEWDDFVALRFHARAEKPRGKAEFRGGAPLRGTIVAKDGRSVSGFVRWDNDEERTWEMLDFLSDGVTLAVELGCVRAIERAGESVSVALRDGRTFSVDETEDASDVGESNRGIFVTTESEETVLVRWRELASATFEP